MNIMFLGASNPETGRMMRAINAYDSSIIFSGFIDNDADKWGTQFLGLPVFGGFDALSRLDIEQHKFVNLITGNTVTRFETSRDMVTRGCKFTNFIHPEVSLYDVSVGIGNYVQEAVVLQAGVSIGDNSSIHMGALIGHETEIGHSVFIAHGCSISGLVQIGDGTFVGTNATVLPRVKIGKWCTIGAGAVVVKDVTDYSVVVGNPARTVRINANTYSDGAIF
jgi:sugar O-acyltransferase (sialic acid O-acetyltransferase NeuD family)